MSSKQTVLDGELFVHALRHMGEEDLLFLNRMVVEHLNLLADQREHSKVRTMPNKTDCKCRLWAGRHDNPSAGSFAVH